MSTFGYSKDRFPNLQGQIFDCIICQCVVRDPKQCTGCGNLFCGHCIDNWMKKDANCPNRCGKTINQMSGGALKKIYNGLQIKCSKCPRLVSLIDIDIHQKNCGRTKCWNEEVCFSYESPQHKLAKPCCSQKCQLLLKLMSTSNNVKEMYNVLTQFKPQKSEKILVSQQKSGINILKWDSSKCGKGISFENDKSSVFLKEQTYVFRSVITSTGFTNGIHYWEIVADTKTQNQLKIGVCTSNSFDFDTAFCDHNFGWAMYGLGQLRHNSNASGPQYGKRFKKQGFLGVYLNMNKGILAFSLNGQSMGVAFTDPELTKGTVYPAVSLLHCAGCTIRGQLPSPLIFQGL